MTIQRLLSPFLLFVLLVQLIALTASLNANRWASTISTVEQPIRSSACSVGNH